MQHSLSIYDLLTVNEIALIDTLRAVYSEISPKLRPIADELEFIVDQPTYDRYKSIIGKMVKARMVIHNGEPPVWFRGIELKPTGTSDRIILTAVGNHQVL